MRLRRMLCHLPGGDAMAENSLSFGCWGRTSSSEWRPPLPRIGEAAVPARVAFHPPCGRPDRAGQRQNTGTVRRNGTIFSAERETTKSKISKFELS